MFKWWKLIKFMSITFGVQVRMFMLNHNSGAIYYNAKTRKTYAIYVPILPTKKTFLIFVHELGHHLHPQGKSDNVLVAELAAWSEAFKLLRSMGIKLSMKEYGMMRAWFSSYALKAAQQGRNADELFNILKVFDKAFVEYYLKGEQ